MNAYSISNLSFMGAGSLGSALPYFRPIMPLSLNSNFVGTSLTLPPSSAFLQASANLQTNPVVPNTQLVQALLALLPSALAFEQSKNKKTPELPIVGSNAKATTLADLMASTSTASSPVTELTYLGTPTPQPQPQPQPIVFSGAGGDGITQYQGVQTADGQRQDIYWRDANNQVLYSSVRSKDTDGTWTDVKTDQDGKVTVSKYDANFKPI
ncbi:MAG: hypothetical protein HEQ32_09515 [Vampirovibrio sp.]